MWEPGTSAVHGVRAGWKIRNPKSEIRNSLDERGHSEFRIGRLTVYSPVGAE